ncbi:aldolase catalytic domain-containing protein [Phaeodactylibacter xiamenensis]|uniref:aldolase catalytic domain-containing protein n=1 Tax=Phaeodactylibacter xiamenensis TaxID=1524460 RepID=UPI003BACB35A
MKTKILDCTLRDGGYYTNWDFPESVVQNYLEAFNHIPIEFLEIGYRSVPMKSYMGEFFYCPPSLVQKIKSVSNKKLAILIDEKNTTPKDAEKLLEPVRSMVDMVRVAINPKNINRALHLGESIKKLGFALSFNVMYMSTWKNNKAFLESASDIDDLLDYFYMVDSFGGVYPEEVKNSIHFLRSKTSVKLGFHSHNNLEMAFSNTLTAIEHDIDIVDATITGMGRGAGNLKTELLLTALNAQNKIDFPFNELSKVVDTFSELQKEYQWGTNLPYMVSGANSLPQKDVMSWVSKRYYSFNSIIRALQNLSKGQEDNEKLQTFRPKKKVKNALIVGGGSSVSQHSKAIAEYLNRNPDILIIHASSKNAMIFKHLKNPQYFCLVGNEGYRMEDVFHGTLPNNTVCILPPYPRVMGTYIPSSLKHNAKEIAKNTFTDKYIDSHTAIALQAALDLKVKHLYLAGYDGYASEELTIKTQELTEENKFLFSCFMTSFKGEIVALTPTVYIDNVVSIYSLL